MNQENNNIKTEKIGNVVLNYAYYSGDDAYSEGANEDQLLEIVQNYRESDYDYVIELYRSWSVMYHLSHVRENIVNWLPMNGNEKVLEIGSGCGAITGMLAKMAGHVTCIDLSKKRSLINAYRHKECDNLDIIVGNFKDIEPNLTDKYDYITLTGVLEYAGCYIGGDDSFLKMLEIAKSHLTDNGKLYIAIENKYGLKYFAGCREDHSGKYYEGIEGYSDDSEAKTFSKLSLEKMLNQAGFSYRFYYPYPDYKLPHSIYSDEFMPKKRELTTNIRNFDADRIVTFDEGRTFDSFIDEGLFGVFSNSFAIIATKRPIEEIEPEIPIFVRCSNDRAPEYRISTVITQDGSGKKHVYKDALNRSTNKHVKDIYENYEELKMIYEDSKLVPNKCEYILGKENAPEIAGIVNKARDKVELEYVEGITLEKYLDDLNEKGQYGHMQSVIKEYCSLIFQTAGQSEFRDSAEFKEVFGNVTLKEHMKASPVCNYDMIFSNIVVDGEKLEKGNWNVLDYEWMFRFHVPAKFIIYRALFYYNQHIENSGFIKYLKENDKDLFSEYGIEEDELEIFKEMEHNFQVYIINGRASLDVLKEVMPTTALRVDEVLKESMYLRALNTPKVYFSSGDGFSPENMLNLIASVREDNVVTLSVPITNSMLSVRIDPTEYPCFVHVNQIRLKMLKGMDQSLERYMVNGYKASSNTFLFDTDDAQIVMDIPRGVKNLVIEYQVKMLPKEFFYDLCDSLKQINEKEETITFADKVLFKLKLKKRSSVREGFRYNFQ